MAATTLYRLAEQTFNLLEGGTPAAASSLSINELKIACGQAINQLLKLDYMNTNMPMGERIPNGSCLGYYEGIEVGISNGKSYCDLPIVPLKLPRDMGVWGIYIKKDNFSNYDYDNPSVPVQLGQFGQLQSQPLLNDLMGKVGHERYGNRVIFTKNIKSMFPDVVVAMRLAVMDISLYGDYDPLPILPEMESEVINMVVKQYGGQPIPDKVVDSTVKEQMKIPINQQKQPE